MKTLFLLTLSLAGWGIVQAGPPRSSDSYSVPAESVDAAGKRATSAAYSNDASLGGITGISTVSAPAETVKHGYIGQLYEVTALQLAAAPTTINETGTRQLAAAQLLDDLTTIAVPAASITWSIQSGPLSSISAGGLATAGTVYQDSAASVQGSYGGLNGSLNLTVLNTIADNFGSYAGDGIGDDWQVQYFGFNNPNAAPVTDPDHDGLFNLLEFAVGLSPLTPSIQPVSTFKNGANLEFIYTRANRAMAEGVPFIVEWTDTLAALSWSAAGVTQEVISDNGTVQQVKAIIPAGSNGRRFVHLKVTGPP